MTTGLPSVSDLVSLDTVYRVAGLMLVGFSAMIWRDGSQGKRFWNGVFWFLLGITYLGGEKVSPKYYPLAGLIVIALVLIEAFGLLRAPLPKPPAAPPPSPGNAVFRPVLVVPAVTFGLAGLFALAGRDVSTGMLVGLGGGGILAGWTAMRITKASLAECLEAGRKVTQEIGAVGILPQLLASLGTVFTLSGVGATVAGLTAGIVPANNPLAAGVVYFGAMSLFTAITGNSFAAFPVITTGIGIPLLISPYSLDPALVGILGLTAGSCGTLITPMAANFNILPTTLYEMKDEYGIVRKQFPAGCSLWIAHVLIFGIWLYWIRPFSR